MTRVKVSPKFQVVIPKEIRDEIKLKPGQELQVIHIGDRLELIPIKDIKEYRGIFKGIDTRVGREKKDRL